MLNNLTQVTQEGKGELITEMPYNNLEEVVKLAAENLERKDSFLLKVWMYQAYPELHPFKGKIGIIANGSCLERIGVKSWNFVVIQLGKFDYKPDDVVLVITAFKGRLIRMLKAFNKWIEKALIAEVGTRYTDSSKDFSFLVAGSLILGKAIYVSSGLDTGTKIITKL
ncbi:MAG: hypothetical protein PWP65_1026 [Clostridia bacterium]|nr:hypothetical protein [Clostridia bacterium]